MKNIKYILFLLLATVVLNSCEEVKNDINDVANGENIAAFESYRVDLVALANGDEYDKTLQVKITGPSVANLTDDITITVTAASSSTAVEGDHYRFGASGNTITLSKSNNYLGLIDVIMMTEGNTPPMDGTPEFEDYVAPFIDLDITAATGNSGVIPTGKTSRVTLNFTPPNPYAGEYNVEMRYFHPTAGGSHPSEGAGFDPDNPYGGIRNYVKELEAVTGRKCKTGFAVWGDTDICWITVNVDNSITYEVDDTWPYDVKLGNPFDPSQVPHFDPATGIIYMYYHYTGTGGDRIFWEIFTPNF